MATNENIVTDRSTDGAKPAKTPKNDKVTIINSNFSNRLAFVLAKGDKIKVIKVNNKPTCKPETDNMCTAPAN